MIKAYIFDFDGTLANTIYDIGDTVNAMIERRGLPPRSYDEYYGYVGWGIGVTLGRVMPAYEGLPPEEQAALRKEFSVLYEERCLEKTVPYKGMAEALEALSRRGGILGIFTNKPEPAALKIAAAIFPKIGFHFILGGVEGKPLKPNPERVLAELEKLGIDPVRALFIGDGKTDIDTGKNGGMKTCGVLWGFKNREELEGADYIISTPGEIPGIV